MRETACSRLNEYKINWISERSINNWITQNNLICEDNYEIGEIGAYFLFGTLLGSLLISPLSDIVGRRKVLLPILLLLLCECYFIVQVGTIRQIDKLTLTLGFLNGARVAASYIYCLETLPKHGKATVAALIIFF